jgi:hypothetical protein
MSGNIFRNWWILMEPTFEMGVKPLGRGMAFLHTVIIERGIHIGIDGQSSEDWIGIHVITKRTALTM